MIQAELREKARIVRVRWPDGAAGDFPYLWLRDNCPSGFHPDTKERSFDLTQAPPDVRPTAIRALEDALEVDWAAEGLVSRFDPDWLRAHRPGTPTSDPAEVTPRLWRGDLGARGVPRAAAAEIMRSDDALLDWMIATKRTGLSIVDGIADDPEAGVSIARRVGFLRETNFGETFEVESKPGPNNLAFTADALPLHTDLPNQELPPGFQFLHCLANEALGGGSVFCDGFAAAEDLRRANPEAFNRLASTPIEFRFHDADNDIRRRRPVIRRGPVGEVEEISFNAHIAGVFDLPPEEMEPYYRAYRAFMQRLREPSRAVTLKLQAGEMAVFDNRRALHGREAFNPSTGRRRLRGCYVDRGDWDSRMRVLSRVSG